MTASVTKDRKFYLKLFLSTFCLSAFTFGGGFVIIPLMRRKFVQELGWIDENDMMDIAAIAQSAPGSSSINASIMLGFQMAGMKGAFVSILGTVMPPMLILSVVSVFYTFVRDNAVVGALMKGMQAGVAAVICDVAISMGAGIIKQKKVLPVVTMAGSFVALHYLNLNVVLVIVICGILGGASTWRAERRARQAAQEKAAPTAHLTLVKEKRKLP